LNPWVGHVPALIFCVFIFVHNTLADSRHSKGANGPHAASSTSQSEKSIFLLSAEACLGRCFERRTKQTADWARFWKGGAMVVCGWGGFRKHVQHPRFQSSNAPPPLQGGGEHWVRTLPRMGRGRHHRSASRLAGRGEENMITSFGNVLVCACVGVGWCA